MTHERRKLQEGWIPGKKGMTPREHGPTPKKPPPKPGDSRSSAKPPAKP